MKKLLPLLCLILTCVGMNAQQIDKQEEDGTRIIISDRDNLYSKWSTGAGFDLSTGITPSGDQFWWLDITLSEGKGQIEENRVLLIKFDNDEVLELKNDKAIGPADYTYRVTTMGTTYYLHPRYPISEEQLNKLLNGTVTKVRIEHDAGHFDREINGKKFHKRINKMYDQIKKRMTVSNDVHDGF